MSEIKNVEWLQERQKYATASQMSNILAHYLPEQYSHLGYFEDFFGQQKQYTSKYVMINEKRLNTEQILQWQVLSQNNNTRRGLANEDRLINVVHGAIKNIDIFFNEMISSTPDAFLYDENNNRIAVVEVKNPRSINVCPIENWKIQVVTQIYTSGLADGLLYIEDIEGEKLCFKLNINDHLHLLNDIKKAVQMFFNDVNSDINPNPDLNFEKDFLMYNILNPSYRIENISNAIMAVAFLEKYIKLYEEAKEFLKHFAQGDEIFNGYQVVKKTIKGSVWTEDLISKEKEKILYKLDNLQVGNQKTYSYEKIFVKKYSN